MMARTHKGCCSLLHLREDNARFFLLMVVMVLYMLAGASVFMVLERDNEIQEKSVYQSKLDDFYAKYDGKVDRQDVEELLKVHSEAEAAGIVGNRRDRWDFSGSFYFVGTVVSTIGKKLCLNIFTPEFLKQNLLYILDIRVRCCK